MNERQVAKRVRLDVLRYRDAVRWIARNDEAAELDVSVVERQISVLLIAYVWVKDATEVAHDVLAVRRRQQRAAR